MSKVEKLHTKYLLTKKTSLLFLLCSFLVLFVWVCVVLFFVIVFLFSICSFPTYYLFGFPIFFCFHKCVFATIHLYHIHFPYCWDCIVLLFIVAFLFFTCSFPSLLFEFSIFFVSINIFLQQSICFFNMVTKI